MNVLLTGSTGYIGNALLKSLITQKYDYSVENIITVGRNKPISSDLHYEIKNFDDTVNWQPILSNIDLIIHVAGVAHNKSCDFETVNYFGTLHLATQAAKNCVKRFIFISTIGVNGNFTSERKFSENDIPAPSSEYALSKYKAELGLQKIMKAYQMDVIIIRPPMVYGKDAPGSYSMLRYVVDKGFPLPLNSINNIRSFIYIENLLSFILCCMISSKAGNKTFLISDDQDLSTKEFVEHMAGSIYKKHSFFYFPKKLLYWVCKVLRKEKIIISICENLELDISNAKNTLGWVPTFTVKEAFEDICKR